MINEKIDHHFNEFSPVDFNIFGDTLLFDKLKRENLPRDKANALHNHITVIKDQIESLLNQEDEQLTTAYGFLTLEEQKIYRDFLKRLQEDCNRYLSFNDNRAD